MRSTAAIAAEQLGQVHNLNPRQVAVLDELLARGQTGVDELEAAFPKVSRRTLQRDLAALLNAGLITTTGDRTDPTRKYRADLPSHDKRETVL